MPQHIESAMQCPRAVVFTHFGSFGRFTNFDQLQNQKIRLIEYYTNLLQRFMKCNHRRALIGIVYIYVDWVVRRAIPNLKVANKKFGIDNELTGQEHYLIDILSAAETDARNKLNLSHSDPPKFRYIGFLELINLLNHLIDVDPEMLHFLYGNKGIFTYDSPKFVEAVIRLSRGDIPSLACHPIIRVDEDAQINPHVTELLIKQTMSLGEQKQFSFFSSRYGRTDGIYDPINDYAVRTHWFFPTDTKAGDKRFEKPNDDFLRRIDTAETFLADLTVLGAVQPTKHNPSKNLKQLIKIGKISQPEARKSSQVISGAGLIMSRRNINVLPPFTNFDNMVSWIDDHLKRRLHEMLKDMLPDDIEVIHPDKKACFQQERDPGTLTKSWIDASRNYFERLLRGCLFHALITDQKAKPTAFSELLRDIAWHKTAGSLDTNALRDNLSKIAENRYDNVLECWQSDEFEGFASYEWAIECKKNNDHRLKLCNPQDGQVIKDTFAYIELMRNWHIFTRAIERLTFIGNRWLFEPIEY